MCRIRQQFATVCAVYASKTHNFTRFCYRMRRVRQQIATVCAVYASKLLPHAPHTLANCYRMRRQRQQFATAYAAYASKVLPHAPSTLTNSKYKCYSCLFRFASIKLFSLRSETKGKLFFRFKRNRYTYTYIQDDTYIGTPVQAYIYRLIQYTYIQDDTYTHRNASTSIYLQADTVTH